jgi:hypothetical protein
MNLLNDVPPGASAMIRVPIKSDASSTDKPDADRPALERMRAKWRLPDTLMGGTAAMQEASLVNTRGSTRANVIGLIREQDETDDEFLRRVSRTVLTNYYGDTIDRHSGLPFAKEIQFDPPLPPEMAYIASNVDGCGRSITVFAREVLREGIHRGLTHVLVDMPPGPDRDYSDTLKRRPVMLHIQPSCLFGVTEQTSDSGDESVVYARMLQHRTERVGQFGERVEDRVLIIEAAVESAAGMAVEYAKDKNGDWIPGDEVAYGSESIPLFTFYGKQIGDHEGEPAYTYLAELNNTHYQSDGDQRHGLSFGRRGTLVQTGWKENANPAEAAAKGQQPAKRAVLGYGRALKNTNEGANAFLLETGGAPLAAGQVDLNALQERMERFGAAQVSKGGGITATSRRLDDKRDTCNLEAWCTRLEQVLLAAVRAMAEWKGITLPEDQKMLIDRSFADDMPDSEDIPHILQMGSLKLLSTGTVLAEMKLRGVLKTVVDPDAELVKIVEEAERTQQLQLDQMAARMIAERENAPEPAEGEGGEDAPSEPEEPEPDESEDDPPPAAARRSPPPRQRPSEDDGP